MPGNSIAIQNDPVLTNIWLGYQPQDMEFIQDQILPTVSVSSDKGDVPTLGSDYLRIHTDLILDKSGTPEIDASATKASLYQTERHGLKIPVTRTDGKRFNNADWRAGMRQAEMMYTKMLKKARMVAREYALAQVLQSASTITQNVTLTGSDKWSDYVNSTPIEDIQTGKDTVFAAIGREPNTLVISRAVFNKLKNHPQLKKTNGVAPDGTVPVRSLRLEEIAQALDVQKILVGSVFYNSAKKGASSPTLTQVWGDHATLMYINPSPTADMIEYSAGFKFVLEPVAIDSYEATDPKDVRFVRYDEEYDDVLVSASACYLIVNAI